MQILSPRSNSGANLIGCAPVEPVLGKNKIKIKAASHQGVINGRVSLGGEHLHLAPDTFCTANGQS